MTAIALRRDDVDALARSLALQLTRERSFVTVPLPWAPPERALAAATSTGFALVESGGEALVGLELARIPGTDDDVRAFLAGVAFDPGADVAPAAVMCLPFEVGATSDDTGFFVPLVALRVRRGRAYLTALGTQLDRGRVEAVATRVLHALARTPAQRLPGVVRRESDDADAYRARVAAACAAIDRGALRKVVLARRVLLSLAGPVEPAALLAAFGAGDRGSHRYAACFDGSVFAGATPERLVTVDQGEVFTEAVAGTAGREDGEDLLASTKDAEEHAAVVEAIGERLAPLVRSLDRAPRPELRRLRDLVHLVTPFRGHLADGVGAIDLVRALHPTPAVSGVPAREAARFLAEAEGFPRGQYAGPLGYVDARGDARVVVALRGARFEGARVEAYVGAGIVRGSTPERELRETELKLRTVLGVFDGAPI